MRCFGSKARAAQQKEIEKLEEEQEKLRTQAQRLKDSIKSDESAKRSMDEEINSEVAQMREKEADMQAAEWERKQLLEELAEANKRLAAGKSSPKKQRSVQWQDEAEEAARSPETPGGFAKERLVVPPPPGTPLSSPQNDTVMVEAWKEAERLMKEIASLSSEVEAGRHRSGPEGVQAAEAAAAELRTEVAQARDRLEAAEAEGERLEAEHRTLEKEEEPLQEWVEHVERELALARTENSELSKSLITLSDQRADLQRDELEAPTPPNPRGGSSIADTAQVRWLEEQEFENAMRKEVLLEEIAAHRHRREQFLEEAAGCHQEAKLNQHLGLGQALPKQHRPPLFHAVARAELPSNLCTASTAVAGTPAVAVAGTPAVTAPGTPAARQRQQPGSPGTGGGRGGYGGRTISPVRHHAPLRSPQVEAPVPRRLAAQVEPAERPSSPLLSSPTPLAQLLARGTGERGGGAGQAQRFLMPELPDPYSSGEDEASGVQAGYWTALPEDLE